MTWPIVELAFWDPGDPGSAAVDALLVDPTTPLARHGLTGIAAAYAAETGARIHPEQRWWIDELAAKSLAVDGALTEVVPALRDAGIPFFVAKGPTIAYVDYPDPSMRPYTDLDVYTTPEERPRAVEVLADLNYHPVDQVVGPLGGQPRELHGGSFGAVVEVHDSVVDNYIGRRLTPIADFLRSTITTDIIGVPTPMVFGPPRIDLLAVHLGAGHRYARLVCLRDLVEIDDDRAGLRTEVARTYLDTADALVASLHGTPNKKCRGALARATVTALASRDPACWDEHRITYANLLALASQPHAWWWVSALVSGAGRAPRRARRAPVRWSVGHPGAA